MMSAFAAVLLLQATPPTEETAPNDPAPPPSACESDVHAGFDFWIGEWEVSPAGSETVVANSTIEKLSGGCAVRETWKPLNSTGGTSVSVVNHRTGRWQQLWAGADGRRVDFEGGVVDGKMVLTGYWDDTGGPGVDALVRMTYTANADGSVRQHGEMSSDHGLTWKPSFDLIYRKPEK